MQACVSGVFVVSSNEYADAVMFPLRVAGGVDLGEPLQDAAIRECSEEAGISIKLTGMSLWLL